jgi:hypothetical protein
MDYQVKDNNCSFFYHCEWLFKTTRIWSFFDVWTFHVTPNCISLSNSRFILTFRYCIYPTVTSARSCNKVGHLFWFTILAQHETNDVILYIHSVHKHIGNSFQRQNYKMRLKQRSLNLINSMKVKKILFTNVFFSLSLCLLNMFPSMVFPKHLYFSSLLT